MRFAGFMLAATLAAAALAVATPVRAIAADPAAPIAAANQLDARQYHLGITDSIYDTASQTLTRQRTTAWQVTHGNWNGQPLTGLSLVLVESIPDNMSTVGAPARMTLYVSDTASTAQRQAAADAVIAAHPEIFPTRLDVHVEPAFIQFEQVGHQMIVHLGLVA